MYLKHFFLIGFLIISQLVNSQKMVSITIDDIPNAINFKKNKYQSLLLNKLDALKIPIAVFVNEVLIYSTETTTKNFDLLDQWAQRDYITLGNHTFNHARYSDLGLEAYKDEIIKGEAISKQLAKKYNKSLTHFRFPYNDLGKDSIQQTQIKNYLTKKGYHITPFTIESSDWMYNFVYEYYLTKNNLQKAKEIGEAYINKTLAYFDFFEALAQKDYQRPIKQIYLCHDNTLNADYLPQLITALKQKGYSFISLDNALTDTIYQQKTNYYQKWGVSWLYRWEIAEKDRYKNMREQPSTTTIQKLYNSILKEMNK
ncbi:Polysaccharide deacetylase [Tenacibaculum sp. 190524A02b]